MNSLSWLIYFADVLPNISSSVKLIGWTIFTLVLIVLLILAGVLLENNLTSEENAEVTRGFRKMCYLLIFSLVLLVSASLLPSKETIYAIAVSETGEKVLQSEWGKRGARAIEAWINQQLIVPTK